MRNYDSLIRQISLYGSRILFGISAGMALSALIYLILNIFFGQYSPIRMYWLAYPSYTDDRFVTLLIGSGIFIWSTFVFLAFLSYRFHEIEPYARTVAKGVTGTIIAAVLLYGGYMVSFFQTGPLAHWETIESVSVNGRTYHLLLYADDWAESWSKYYHLYECDRFDLFCSEIKTIAQSNGEITSSVEKIRLIGDELANTVTIEVNGTNAFTYPSN